MRIIVLNEYATKDKIPVKKSRMLTPSKEYQDYIDEANNYIKEAHRSYAEAYRTASKYLVM